MNWWLYYRADVRRYQQLSGRSALGAFLLEQGLWALLIYRIASAIYHSQLAWPFKRMLLLLAVLGQKWSEVITGISLPYAASIGPGFYIGHYGNIIIHPQATIGSDCNISQGVTIGISGRGHKRGVPTIGDRVFIAPGSTVIGKIMVGSDAVIGANSLVNRDVPTHTTVLGVPAQIVSQQGSAEYISPAASNDTAPDESENSLITEIITIGSPADSFIN